MSAVTEHAVAAAAAGTAGAMAALSRAAEPCTRTRRLTLADHDAVVLLLEFTASVVAESLRREGSSIAGRSPDLGRTFRDAAIHVTTAAQKAAGSIAETGRAVRELPDGSADAEQSRSCKLTRAARDASDAAERLEEALRNARLPEAAHQAVAGSLWHAVTDLQSAFGYEAILVSGAFEEARMSRRGDRASDPLAAGSIDLRHAGRFLHVAVTVLRDGLPRLTA